MNRAFQMIPLSLLVLVTGSALAQDRSDAAAAGIPDIVRQPLLPPNRAAVEQVARTAAADVVVLADGIGAGFRRGMVLTVSRGNAAVAELIVVAVGENRTAALITSLSEGASIQAGDIASIKTISTRTR